MQVQQYSKPHMVALRGKLFDDNGEQAQIYELKAKIVELEHKLHSQKETVDKGNLLMKVIYGSRFEQDFLF